MSEVFGVNTQAITRHIKNVYSEKELEEKATCSKMEQVRIEGNRKVVRQIEYYNLDVIISVGYRVNTTMGTNFRKWATKTLKDHITKGFTINKSLIAKNYESFMFAVNEVKNLYILRVFYIADSTCS
jgi:hypothetical protein